MHTLIHMKAEKLTSHSLQPGLHTDTAPRLGTLPLGLHTPATSSLKASSNTCSLEELGNGHHTGRLTHLQRELAGGRRGERDCKMSSGERKEDQEEPTDEEEVRSKNDTVSELSTLFLGGRGKGKVVLHSQQTGVIMCAESLCMITYFAISLWLHSMPTRFFV